MELKANLKVKINLISIRTMILDFSCFSLSIYSSINLFNSLYMLLLHTAFSFIISLFKKKENEWTQFPGWLREIFPFKSDKDYEFADIFFFWKISWKMLFYLFYLFNGGNKFWKTHRFKKVIFQNRTWKSNFKNKSNFHFFQKINSKEQVVTSILA